VGFQPAGSGGVPPPVVNVSQLNQVLLIQTQVAALLTQLSARAALFFDASFRSMKRKS
jgi:hypothetical protein